MKRMYILLLILLALVSVLSASELVHKQYIENLNSYYHIKPLTTADGLYRGFIATNLTDDVIDVYDSLADKTHSIPFNNNLLMSFGRLSNNSDTLIIYSLEDTAWSGNPYDFYLYIISEIKIFEDSILIQSIRPNYSYPDENGLSSKTASIELKRNSNFEPEYILFKSKINTYYHIPTMGTTYRDHYIHNIYSLDISEMISSTNSTNYLSGDFDSSDDCGLARTTASYVSVQDDPWNSYTSSSSWVGIYNCDSLLKGKSSGGNTSFILTGNFLPQTENDEVIYAGSTADLLEIREGLVSRWVCYKVENDTISEVWWREPPWKFESYFYEEQRNLIFGIANGLTIHQFDCAVGEYQDSVALDHIMNERTFLVPFTGNYPMLFGEYGDTIFIYSYNTPTDIDDEDNDLLLPENYSLYQNYPNPFNPSTTILFQIPSKSYVEILIYNVMGQKITSLGNKQYSAGTHAVSWDGKNSNGESVSSGIYLYKMTSDNFTDSKKLMLLK